MPTAIWKSRLRSGSAHCDLEVAVEVRQCPLGSGLRGGGRGGDGGGGGGVGKKCLKPPTSHHLHHQHQGMGQYFITRSRWMNKSWNDIDPTKPPFLYKPTIQHIPTIWRCPIQVPQKHHPWVNRIFNEVNHPTNGYYFHGYGNHTDTVTNASMFAPSHHRHLGYRCTCRRRARSSPQRQRSAPSRCLAPDDNS